MKNDFVGSGYVELIAVDGELIKMRWLEIFEAFADGSVSLVS